MSWKSVLKHPLTSFLTFTFIVTSWPFIGFPLTDGDTAHWVGIATEINKYHNFLTSSHDQAHGPLLPWMTALLLYIKPGSYYLYNLFNLLCACLGVGYVYYFTKQFFEKAVYAKMVTFFFSTSIVCVYLSRTPMYDWPAALFFFIFCGYYLSYIREHRLSHLALSFLALGLASLCRFSISLGLSGIYVLLIHWIWRYSAVIMVRNGLLMLLTVLAFNAPWLYYQTQTHGPIFLDIFFNDNIGRFFKEPHQGAMVHRDFYAFPIYILIGCLPHTFAFLALFKVKNIIRKALTDKVMVSMLASALPCVILFSLSGHVKLARYIAFSFPALFIFLGVCVQKALNHIEWQQCCGKMILYTGLALSGLLTMLIIQFPSEVNASWLFSGSIIVLLFGLLIQSYYSIVKNIDYFKEYPERFLISYALIYCLFFSVLAFEYRKAPFLNSVNKLILHEILKQ